MRRFLWVCLLNCSAVCADEIPGIACFKQLVTEPKFAPIANKLPLGDIRDISFPMLANKTMPTKKESNLIAEWVEAKKGCFAVGLEYAQKNYPPQFIPLATEANNRVIAVAASLYNKELTYGSANKKIQAIADDYASKLTAVAEQIKSERAAQQLAQEQAKKQQDIQAKAQQDNDRRIAEQRQADADAQWQQQQAQADAQKRQLGVQMLMNNMNNNRPVPYQIVPPPVLRPSVTTNCNQYGNQITCNSN
jgi:hypothetical protein